MNLSQLLKEMSVAVHHAEKYKTIEPEEVTSIDGYAQKRIALAEKLYGESIAEGSSRIVFQTHVLSEKDFAEAKKTFGITENIPTAFKLAKNNVGRAQNKAEFAVYQKVKQFPEDAKLLGKILNADKKDWWWIEMEWCESIDAAKDQEIANYFHIPFDKNEGSMYTLFRVIDKISREGENELGKKYWWVGPLERISKHTRLVDITKSNSWGKTKDGRIAIIDYGFTDKIADKYYGGRRYRKHIFKPRQKVL